MGCTSMQPSKPQLTIATLNYSGIHSSPYQFYQSNDQQIQIQQQVSLNIITKTLYQKYKLSIQNESFQFGPFEQQWKHNRYSPLYNEQCGIKHNIYMMNQQQFREQWFKYQQNQQQNLILLYNQYQKTRGKYKKIKKIKFYLNNLYKFDSVIYQAILRSIYTTKEQMLELDNNFRIDSGCCHKFKLSATKFRNFTYNKFNKSYFNQEHKAEKIIKIIRELNIDVLFIQEVTQTLLELIQNNNEDIRIVKSSKQNQKELLSKSAILIRQNYSKFPKLRSLLHQNTRLTNNINLLMNPQNDAKFLSDKDIMDLNIGENTVIQFLYNVILISTWFPDQENQNQRLVKLLKQKIVFLKQNFPTCYIIVGGSLNCKQIPSKFSYFCSQKIREFQSVPSTKYHCTSRKKLTHLQPNQQNADKIVSRVSDYLISDTGIRNAKIMTIDNRILIDCENEKQNINNLPLLPTENHPFQHYLVVGKIIIDQSLEHVTDYSYRLKYNPTNITSKEFLHNQIETIKKKYKEGKTKNDI